MKQSSLKEVIARLLVEIDAAEIYLDNLRTSLATIQSLSSEPEKPTERVPLFTVSKATKEPKREPVAKRGGYRRKGVTTRTVLQILADNPGIRVRDIFRLSDGRISTLKAAATAIHRLTKDDTVVRDKNGLYRITSATTDPGPSPADPERSPEPE